MRNRGILLAVLAVAWMARPAQPERPGRPSDEKVAQALRLALRAAADEGRPFNPRRETLTIGRKGTAWNFHFGPIPYAGGRVLPDSDLLVTVRDDGQVNVLNAL